MFDSGSRAVEIDDRRVGPTTAVSFLMEISARRLVWEVLCVSDGGIAISPELGTTDSTSSSSGIDCIVGSGLIVSG